MNHRKIKLLAQRHQLFKTAAKLQKKKKNRSVKLQGLFFFPLHHNAHRKRLTEFFGRLCLFVKKDLSCFQANQRACIAYNYILFIYFRWVYFQKEIWGWVSLFKQRWFYKSIIFKSGWFSNIICFHDSLHTFCFVSTTLFPVFSVFTSSGTLRWLGVSTSEEILYKESNPTQNFWHIQDLCSAI